jgi:hypothetical protein
MFRRVPTAVNVRIMNSVTPTSAARYGLSRPEVPGFLEGLIDLIHGLSTPRQYPM